MFLLNVLTGWQRGSNANHSSNHHRYVNNYQLQDTRPKSPCASTLAFARAWPCITKTPHCQNHRLSGHTTPALADVGCASVRLRFCDGGESKAKPIEDGGYLLALMKGPESMPRSIHGVEMQGASNRQNDISPGVLPAIAAVPGEKGLDRYMKCRKGLAECVVMSRPICIEGEEDG